MEIIEGKMPFMGYETYYRIVGKRSEKPPLILLHGGPGSTHNYFEVLETKNNSMGSVLGVFFFEAIVFHLPSAYVKIVYIFISVFYNVIFSAL